MKTWFISLFMLTLSLNAVAAKHSYTVTPAKAKDFVVTCGETATAITAVGVTSITQVVCQNLSATPVYIGGSDVGTAFPICNDTGVCGYNVFPIPAKTPYCKVASGTANIGCLAVFE